MKPTRQPAAVTIALLHATAAKGTPGLAKHPQLEPTHRIMKRWAVSEGTGLPSERWEDDRRDPMPPLDDDTAIKVDRIIQKDLDRKYRKLVVLWYKSQAPNEVIARRLGLPGKSSLYPEWRAILFYLRGRFQGVGIDC